MAVADPPRLEWVPAVTVDVVQWTAFVVDSVTVSQRAASVTVAVAIAVAIAASIAIPVERQSATIAVGPQYVMRPA